jgi:hypothetical protein
MRIFAPSAPSAPPPTDPPATFTSDEWRALEALRLQHPQYGEFFSRQELARLRFLRWLNRTNRL